MKTTKLLLIILAMFHSFNRLNSTSRQELPISLSSRTAFFVHLKRKIIQVTVQSSTSNFARTLFSHVTKYRTAWTSSRAEDRAPSEIQNGGASSRRWQAPQPRFRVTSTTKKKKEKRKKERREGGAGGKKRWRRKRRGTAELLIPRVIALSLPAENVSFVGPGFFFPTPFHFLFPPPFISLLREPRQVCRNERVAESRRSSRCCFLAASGAEIMTK